MKKIKEVVWQNDKEKSPGPFGFNLDFFKKWDFLEEDIVYFVQELHKNVKLHKSIIATFLTIMSKLESP